MLSVVTCLLVAVMGGWSGGCSVLIGDTVVLCRLGWVLSCIGERINNMMSARYSGT